MVKRAKKKAAAVKVQKAPKPKKAVYSYYAENMSEIAEGDAALVTRFNQIGAHGWRLMFLSGNIAWFVGDDTATTPPVIEHDEQQQPQPQP
ncbi:MAG TPA: hypothetical protein VGH47_13755 [Xanthobacteraceae bacterium]|jgi:hypothetical protein